MLEKVVGEILHSPARCAGSPGMILLSGCRCISGTKPVHARVVMVVLGGCGTSALDMWLVMRIVVLLVSVASQAHSLCMNALYLQC